MQTIPAHIGLANPVVALLGSRRFEGVAAARYLASVAERIVAAGGLVVSGGCAGACRLAEAWARAEGRALRVFRPDWRRFGRAAGVIRSADLLRWLPPGSPVVLFLPAGLPVEASRGCLHELDFARSLGLPVWVARPAVPGVAAPASVPSLF